MTDKLTRGLEFLKWLSHSQGKQFLACRHAGRPCAFRFQRRWNGRKFVEIDVPFLCGFITVLTTCEVAAAEAVQGRLL